VTSYAAPEPRDIAVVAFAQSDTLRSTAEVSEVERRVSDWAKATTAMSRGSGAA